MKAFRTILLSCLLTLAAPFTWAASHTVRGTVTTPDQAPIPGVRVTIQETNQSTLTDNRGQFTISLASSRTEVHLVFENDAFYTLRRTLTVSGESTELDVQLNPLQRISENVTVSATRTDIPLDENPAATTVVGTETLDNMPRGINAQEALASVPGVKVDDQADGERVHISIRGQGILSERGIRGIQVLLDGIPLNDPSGFAPDLFDVDWTDVDRVDVMRGPMGAFYGGGSAGGVISITTRNGGDTPVGGGVLGTAGSYGFYKAYGDVGGTAGSLNYHASVARTRGDGYRDHTAFWGNNAYAKLGWQVTPHFHLQTVLAATGFFNQNAEGLNLEWLAEDRRMANPDALIFDEFQKTIRETVGTVGNLDISDNQNLSFVFYFRHTNYKESVPSSVQHRSINSPGTMVQYTLTVPQGRLTHHFSVGSDLDWQQLDEYRRPNLGDAVEGPDRISDQTAHQSRQGVFAMDRLDLGPRWTLLLSLRHDRIRNALTDNFMAGGLDLSGERIFQKTTGRVGLTYSLRSDLDLYTSWGQGFLPPATEELYANPDAFGGFNRHLKPATSQGEEVGARGSFHQRLFYDVTVFHLKTSDDFERYRISDRPLETFYRNAGDSTRYGLETRVKWFPVEPLRVLVAYTYSHFTYTSYDSITYGENLDDHWLPNSPRHQAYLDLEYRLGTHWIFDLNEEIQSRAMVDATNTTWIDGYALLGGRVAYRWTGVRATVEAFASGRNITGEKYIAFTEPDPDGNSYQPGPTAEFYGGLRVTF